MENEDYIEERYKECVDLIPSNSKKAPLKKEGQREGGNDIHIEMEMTDGSSPRLSWKFHGDEGSGVMNHDSPDGLVSSCLDLYTKVVEYFKVLTGDGCFPGYEAYEEYEKLRKKYIMRDAEAFRLKTVKSIILHPEEEGEEGMRYAAVLYFFGFSALLKAALGKEPERRKKEVIDSYLATAKGRKDIELFLKRDSSWKQKILDEFKEAKEKRDEVFKQLIPAGVRLQRLSYFRVLLDLEVDGEVKHCEVGLGNCESSIVSFFEGLADIFKDEFKAELNKSVGDLANRVGFDSVSSRIKIFFKSLFYFIIDVCGGYNTGLEVSASSEYRLLSVFDKSSVESTLGVHDPDDFQNFVGRFRWIENKVRLMELSKVGKGHEEFRANRLNERVEDEQARLDAKITDYAMPIMESEVREARLLEVKKVKSSEMFFAEDKREDRLRNTKDENLQRDTLKEADKKRRNEVREIASMGLLSSEGPVMPNGESPRHLAGEKCIKSVLSFMTQRKAEPVPKLGDLPPALEQQ